jgi:hypothetical protein
VETAGGGGLGLSGWIFAALPIPLGSESDLGLAGPNGTPDIGALPAPAEPAGGVNCANALAGTIRASATKRASAGLRDIEVGLSRKQPSNDHVGRAFPGFQAACFQASAFQVIGFPWYPSRYGVGFGHRIRPNHGAITF